MPDYKHHILVIEDDERLLHLLLQFLSSKGFRATGSGSIEEARERIEGTFFDAYVVDVMLPQESGLDFVRSLGQIRTVERRRPVKYLKWTLLLVLIFCVEVLYFQLSSLHPGR